MPSITHRMDPLAMSEVSMNACPRLTAQVRMQWDPAREKHVLLIPEGVLVLNATAAAILALCDGRRSVSAIAAELGARYDRVVDQEVLAFLDRLASKRLVDFDDEE